MRSSLLQHCCPPADSAETALQSSFTAVRLPQASSPCARPDARIVTAVPSPSYAAIGHDLIDGFRPCVLGHSVTGADRHDASMKRPVTHPMIIAPKLQRPSSSVPDTSLYGPVGWTIASLPSVEWTHRFPPYGYAPPSPWCCQHRASSWML